jgi:hypothetical protein
MARSRFLGRVTFSLMLVCGAGVARGDVLYGLECDASVNDDINPPATWSNGLGNIVPGMTSCTSPVLGVSGTVSPYYASSAVAWAVADGPTFRGYASASASNGLQDSGIFPSDGRFDLEWYDTLLISGNADTTVQLTVTLALDSILEASGGDSSSFVESSVAVINPYGPTQTLEASNGTSTKSMTVDTKGGAELQLFVLLDGYAGAGAMGLPNHGVGSASAVANASDTANTYITVLTPGASYTAASGFNYAPPAAVPEPRSFWLLAALLTIGVGARRRRAGRG